MPGSLLVVTSGDPLSVNIELFLAAMRPPPAGQRLLVIGSAWQWRDQCARLGQPEPAMALVRTPEEAIPGALSFLDLEGPEWQRPAEELTQDVRGHLAVRALDAVPRQDPAGGRLALVTGPIDKYACQLAGFGFPGQTEFVSHLWRGTAVMVLAGPRLRVGLATNHLALKDVASALTIGLLETKLNLLIETLRDAFGIAVPRIAVSGLNPHAGDHGLFGSEDDAVIRPAVQAIQARRRDAVISGPEPADTVFYRAYHGLYDGVLAMYHDQGLGPLKTVHFDTAINLSGGLPHLRVSPDHGPAQDLFLRGEASPASMKEAFRAAETYLRWEHS
jgi:4-hydroxythreonine-4-phosphate dehydrogenase